MHDPELYEEISQDVNAQYNKDKDSFELLSIQSFLDNINDEYIRNKRDALSEFKTLTNSVKSENLRDYIKELELPILGQDDEEPEYEESIAERTKMRRQNKESDQKDAWRTFAPPDPDGDDLDESTEICNKEGFDSDGYNINNIKRNGYDINGFNIMVIII